MNTNTPIKAGQIRHPKKIVQALMKCIGPFEGESLEPNGESQETETFILTRDFPNYHYIVVMDIVESSRIKGVKFCVVHLITHSSKYDNIKITPEIYDASKTIISLTNSYITRDKFLINVDDIEMAKSYGNVDLIKLKIMIEN